MNKVKNILIGFGILVMVALPVFALDGKKVDFQKDAIGADARSFSPIIGMWNIEKDGSRQVYAVNGQKWRQESLSSQAQEKARETFGPESTVFMKNIVAHNEFPLSVCKDCPLFKNGTLTVSFKAIAGKEDQAAGIAFNIKPNGKYLAVRANALENNLVLFTFEKGKRKSLQWAENAPTKSNSWHILKIVVKGKKIEAYLDDKKYIDYTNKEAVAGWVGLWSKADSYVLFDNFITEQK